MTQVRSAPRGGLVRIASCAMLAATGTGASSGCRQLFGIDDTEVAGTADGPAKDAVPIDGEADADPPDGAIDASPDATPVSCGAAYSALPTFPGHTYRAGTTGTPWNQARNSCAADGGYLVVIDSLEEEVAVRAFVPDDVASPFFWVGVSDAMVEGTWVTTAGDPATYLPWASGQPSGAVGENCVLLAEAGGFYDWPCSGPQYYACECGGP